VSIATMFQSVMTSAEALAERDATKLKAARE
jgi:hypothetical protein